MTPVLFLGGVTPVACSAVLKPGLSNPILQLLLVGLEFLLSRENYRSLFRVKSTFLSSVLQNKLEHACTFKLKRCFSHACC